LLKRLSSSEVKGQGHDLTECYNQWRRQDLLRGGAKLEIMSWGTHSGLQGRLQQLLDD